MFESLGKKLTDFGTVAAERTKNVGGRVSLTAKIEAAKRELTGVYAQLGQQIYQDQQTAVPAQYQELFDKIARTEEVLEDYQAQRRVLRGVRPCPDCGADVPNEDEFCAKCGSHLGTVVPEEPETAEEEDFFESEENLSAEPVPENIDADDELASDDPEATANAAGVLNKAADAAGRAKDKAVDFAGKAKDKAGDFAEKAKDKAGDFAEKAKDKAGDFAEKVKHSPEE